MNNLIRSKIDGHINLKIILVLVLLVFQVTLFCQPMLEWELSLGGSNLDEPRVILEDDDGTMIIVARTRSSDIDGVDNNGAYDVWIIKINSIGEVLWQRNYGGSNEDIPLSAQKTIDGGFIISGSSASNDGDITSGNQGGFSDAWLIKLDNVGNLQWEKTYGGSGWDRGWAVLESSDGGYFMLVETNSNDGDVNTSLGLADYWLLKVDSIGSIEWQKSYGGTSDDFPWKMIYADDGNLLLVGDSYSADGNVGGTNGESDFWLLKVDTQGNILSNEIYGGSQSDYVPNIVLHGNEELMLCGSSYSMDGDASANYGDLDIWVVNVDNSGNIQWESNYGGSHRESCSSIKETTNGNFIVGGGSLSQNFDVHSNFGGGDMWIFEIDDLGNILWEENLGGSNADNIQDFIILSDGGILVVGNTSSNDGDVSQNFGLTDIWIVKLVFISAVNGPIKKFSFDVLPNPSDGQFKVRLEGNESDCNVTVTNFAGQTIFRKKNAGREFDIGPLSRGLYSIKVETDNKFEVKMIVIE